MSYDIYGEPLRRGHCEVHPHVHEEYPCSVCLAAHQRHNEQQQYCDGDPNRCESAHHLGQAQEHINALHADNKRLREALSSLVSDCETANRKWVDGIGIGAIDLNAISRARAALQGESES